MKSRRWAAGEQREVAGSVVVDGTVRQGGSGYQVAMRMTSSSGMGAVVDEQQFASANSAVNQSVIAARAS